MHLIPVRISDSHYIYGFYVKQSLYLWILYILSLWSLYLGFSTNISKMTSQTCNYSISRQLTTLKQSQKTQGFCIADFATLSDETRSRPKIFLLFVWIKEPCVRKFEGLERSKLLGISQTKNLHRRCKRDHIKLSMVGSTTIFQDQETPL